MIYEYPGDYTNPSGRAEALAAARMHTFSGRSNCRGFAAGTRFTLKAHPVKAIDNTAYVLTRVRHDARQHLTRGGDADRYGNQFVCLPRTTAFRPPRNHPKPMIGNSQVAVVTGPNQEKTHSTLKSSSSKNGQGNFKLRVNGNITIDASGLVTINGAKIILNG